MNKHNLNKHSFLALVAALMIAPTYVNANTNDNAQKIAVVKKIVNYGDVDGYAKDYKLPRERFYEQALHYFSSNKNWVAPLASQGLKASIKKQQKFEQDVARGVIKNYTFGEWDDACEESSRFYLGQDDPFYFSNYQFKVLKNGNVGMVETGFDDGKKYSFDSYQIKLVKENGTYKIDDVIPPSYGEDFGGEDLGPFFKKSYRQRVDHYCRPGKYQY